MTLIKVLEQIVALWFLNLEFLIIFHYLKKAFALKIGEI